MATGPCPAGVRLSNGPEHLPWNSRRPHTAQLTLTVRRRRRRDMQQRRPDLVSPTGRSSSAGSMDAACFLPHVLYAPRLDGGGYGGDELDVPGPAARGMLQHHAPSIPWVLARPASTASERVTPPYPKLPCTCSCTFSSLRLRPRRRRAVRTGDSAS